MLDNKGEVKYNFSDATKIEFLMVNEAIQSQLAKGILSIVRYENDYAVLPSVVAEKIALRDPSWIVSKLENTGLPDTVEDDPYADYVIPDDLMW